MERIKKLIVVILCVGMISSLNISFIYASQSNGYHPLNIKIESPDVPKTVTPKRNARSLDSYYSSSELGQVTSVKDQGNTELCWAFGITSMGETSLIKQGIASTNIDFSEKHFGYFMYNRKNDILNNTKGDKTKVSGDWRYAGGNSLLAMLSLTGWYGLAKENIAPFNTGKWRLSDSVGQKDSAILKNGFFLGDTPQAAVVKSYIIGYGSVVMAYHAPEETWEETAYYGKNHEAYNCNSARQAANHIVAIVGWDDSYSRDNFNSGSRPSRDGAWIVKNSWGNQEGSNGYTYISYEDKSLCEFVAGQFVKASEYKYNYFYDGSANPGILKLKKGQKFANVFTAKKEVQRRKN